MMDDGFLIMEGERYDGIGTWQALMRALSLGARSSFPSWPTMIP